MRDISKSILGFLTRLVVLSAVLAASSHALAAAAEPINTFGSGGSFFSDPPRTDTAIKGYDTVAYFKENKPVKGKDDFVYTWKGAKWKFSTKENLEAFKADPEKFAPQYGGYCAYGIAKGNAVKIEPDQFTIIEDNGVKKLYLNYDEDISKKWKKDPKAYIEEADKKFAEVVKK